MLHQRNIMVHKSGESDPHEMYSLHYRTDNDYFALIRKAVSDFISIHGEMSTDVSCSMIEWQLEELADSVFQTRERANFCRIMKYDERIAVCVEMGICSGLSINHEHTEY